MRSLIEKISGEIKEQGIQCMGGYKEHGYYILFKKEDEDAVKQFLTSKYPSIKRNSAIRHSSWVWLYLSYIGGEK